MTTIAYRDGVMAADGRVTDGNLVLSDECRKIRRLSDGSLFALTGEDLLEERIIQALENCEALPQGKEFTAILVDTDGVLSTFRGSGDHFQPWYGGPFVAFGSGAEVAYGAMHMGATAAEAVATAAIRDTNTGGAIQEERYGYLEPQED